MIPALALRHWKLLASGLVLALLLIWGGIGWNRAGHWKKAFESEHQAYGIFRTTIIDKTAVSIAENKANVARIESARQTATQEAANAYLQKRDAELALVRERMRARSGQGDSGKAATGTDATLPQGSVRTSPETELHDAEIGAENTLRLEALIAAWNAAAAVPTDLDQTADQ